MKVLYFTDPHFKSSSQYHRINANMWSGELDMHVDSFAHLIELVMTEKPDWVVCGGDIFNDNGSIDPISKRAIEKCFAQLIDAITAVEGYLYILTGNHELYDKGKKISLIKFIEDFSQGYCRVVDDTHKILIDGVGEVGFISYTHDYEKAYELMGECDIVFSHLDFVGENLTPKILSNVGIDADAIPTTTTTKIINGHYHHHNRSFYNNGLVELIHPGAYKYHNHTDHFDMDSNFRRGFHIIDMADFSIETVENRYTEYYFTFDEKDHMKLAMQLKIIDSKNIAKKSRVRVYTKDIDDFKQNYAELISKFASVRFRQYTTKVQVRDEKATYEKITKPDAVRLSLEKHFQSEELDSDITKPLVEEMINTHLIKLP